MSMQLRTFKKQNTKNLETGIVPSNNIEQDSNIINSSNKEIIEKDAAGSSAEV